MNRFYRYTILSVVLVVSSISLLTYSSFRKKGTPESYSSIDRLARIYPDYSGIVCPPNIAPLNFVIKEEGKEYFVKIYSDKGKPIEMYCKQAKVIIPRKPWHKLLNTNRGGKLYYEIYVRTAEGKWNLFESIENKIAAEDIDKFAVYRKMHPMNTLYYGNMGIYQRDLSSYSEKLILDRNYLGKGGCINCHSFCRNNPDSMVVGIRSKDYGVSTLYVHNGTAHKIDTKFGYSSWHPGGRQVTYSVNNLPMFFHTARSEVRDTVDLDSYLAYCNVDSQTVETALAISKKEKLENWPVWSADGKYLYFCSAPLLWEKPKEFPPDEYEDVRYNLVRISHDVTRNEWGRQETVFSSADMDKSVGMPRTSPDGRWLSFCMFDYGFFPTWQKSSDLYLIDLEQANQEDMFTPKKLDINSDQSESWHCWSSNSRWLIFSSKRDYGVFTKLYISYVDENGNAYKPLLLPQKDPLFYDSCLLAYNTPELIIGPVTARCENLAKVIRSDQKISVKIPITMATPKAEATSAGNQNQQRE